MHKKWIASVAALTVLAATGAAVASHVTQVDPTTVPTGFLAAHNAIAEVPVSALARAVTPDGADVFVQHVRLPANAPTGWHTHPGPAIVTTVRGSLTYEDAKGRRGSPSDDDAKAGACRRITYSAGQGFVDRGFGHVHRAVAGADGVDFYVTYLLPPGSATHIVPADPLPECSS